MKRVKTAKQAGVRQSLLMAGLALASVGAQASVTITSGNGIFVDLRAPGSISLQSPGAGIGPLLTYDINQPAPIESSRGSLNAASASSSVSGSLYYSLGTSYGNFSENDSSPDGSMVELDLNRKGYGYRAGCTGGKWPGQGARGNPDWLRAMAMAAVLPAPLQAGVTGS